MKKHALFILLLVSTHLVFSQMEIDKLSETEILNVTYDFAETKRERDFERFQSIGRVLLTLEDEKNLIGKNYEISIETYKNGKLFAQKSIINTALESLPPILDNFELSVMSQHMNGKVKLGFMHQNFSNVQGFDVDSAFNFKDGEFLIRDVCAGTDQVEFVPGEKFQLFLITPPNRDSSKGALGYCEVSQDEINPEAWYVKYEIPQFFLVYMKILNN